MHKFVMFHRRTIQTFGSHCCHCTLLGFCSCATYCYAIVKQITSIMNKPSDIRVQDTAAFIFLARFFWTNRLRS